VITGSYVYTDGIVKLDQYLKDITIGRQSSNRERDIFTHWVKNTLLSILKRNASGGVLRKRTGRLSEAITSNLKLSGRFPNYKYSYDIKALRIPYGRILEEGGTIRPKNGEYLTIPFPGSEAEKVSLRRKTGKVSPLEWEGNLFVWTNKKSGKKLMCKVRQPGDFKSKKLVPMFILERQVTIKPTRWISISLEEAEGELLRQLSEYQLS